MLPMPESVTELVTSEMGSVLVVIPEPFSELVAKVISEKVYFRLAQQTQQNRTFDLHMQPLPQFYQQYRFCHKTTYCFI
jgi:hypothetical protein